MADDLVVSALRNAIAREGESRLIAVGDGPDEAGLFPDRKGPAKKAVQACTEGEKPLLLVREEPGKGKTPVQFARITDRGITWLVSQTKLDRLPELARAAAPSVRVKVLRACLRGLGKRASEVDPWSHRQLVRVCMQSAQEQFQVLEARLQEVLDEERALSETLDEFLHLTRERIDAQKRRTVAALDGLAKAAAELVSPTEAGSTPLHQRLPEWQRVPTTDPEIDFQKNLSEELVFAWQDSTEAPTRAALERALFNVGVERVDEPGAIVPFDGFAHHTEHDVTEGDPVEILLPGWRLTNPRGSRVIARGKVKKSDQPLPPSPAHDEGSAPDGPSDEGPGHPATPDAFSMKPPGNVAG